MMNPSAHEAPIAYSMAGAMDALQISRATLYALIKDGSLRTYRIGRRRYCTHDALVELQHKLEGMAA